MAKTKIKLSSEELYIKLNEFIEKTNFTNRLLDLSHKYYDIVIDNKQEKPETRFRPLKNDFIRYVAKNDTYGFTLYLLMALNDSKKFDKMNIYYVSGGGEKRISRQDILKVQVLTDNQKNYIKKILPGKYFGKELLHSYEIFEYVFNKYYDETLKNKDRYDKNENKIENQKSEFFSFLIDTSELGILTNWKNHLYNNISGEYSDTIEERFSNNCTAIMKYLKETDNTIKLNNIHVTYSSLPSTFKYENEFEFLCKYFSLAYLQDYILYFTKNNFTIDEFEKHIKEDPYFELLRDVNTPSLEKDLVDYIDKLQSDLRNRPDLLKVWTFDELSAYEQKNGALFVSDELKDFVTSTSNDNKNDDNNKDTDNFELDLG